jgi:succinate dehydrogenase/fumarate reductase flavoprotein subunit
MSSQKDTLPSRTCSVLIIGGGNAGFCAGLAASQSTKGTVLLIDACTPSWAGGNTFFTAGAFRTAHAGLDDVLPIVSNVDGETANLIDLAPYPEDEFLKDLDRVTRGQYDRALGKELVDQSNEVVKWLAVQGLVFELSFNRQVRLNSASSMVSDKIRLTR